MSPLLMIVNGINLEIIILAKRTITPQGKDPGCGPTGDGGLYETCDCINYAWPDGSKEEDREEWAG